MSFEAEEFLIEVLHADRVVRRGDELEHACLLPWGNHSKGDEMKASLNADKLLYNCFKCGTGGTLLWATEEILGITSAQARKLIQGNFEDEEKAPEHFLMELERAWLEDPHKTMPRYGMRIVEAWARPTQYLDQRGISREVQEEMKTGINLRNVDDIGGIQVVQPRVVIPHVFGGVLRGWTMRLVDKRQVGNKYKHTSQFPKRATLYNFDEARKYDSVIVVESPLSVLKLKSYGFKNVVGTFGAEVNREQEDILLKFEEVIAFPDGDRAGYRALSYYDRKREILGLAHSLVVKTRMTIVDHGTSMRFNGPYDELNEDGFNQNDPADYTKEQIEQLIEERVPAETWGYIYDWEDEERGNHKTYQRAVRIGTEESWD